MVAHKSLERHGRTELLGRCRQHLGDGTCGIVDDESLLEEAHLAVKLFEAPLDHLVDNLLRLALAEGLLSEDVSLLLQRAVRHVLPAQVKRRRGDHVHRDALAEAAQGIAVGRLRRERDGGGGAADTRRVRVVHVAADHPARWRRGKKARAAQDQVLSELADGDAECLGDRRRVAIERGRAELCHVHLERARATARVDRAVQCRSGDAGRQGLERVVPRDKVSLRVELDDGESALARRDRHGALVRSSRRLLLRGREANLAQLSDRLVDVSRGLVQCLDALLHGRRGACTQLLDQGRAG
mmetsp:Transcript_57410/g.157662  ORF Transcript_57410/g.157662 Transcript_57410/m.157662 type:complete len:299 (-) Transcript_57410:111-1007(-)